MIQLPLVNFTTQLTSIYTNGSDDFGGNAIKTLYALDDDSCVLFYAGQLRTPGIQAINIYVTDASGIQTWYQTINIGDNGGFVSSILSLGAGFFNLTLGTVNSGQTWTFNFQVRNLKLQNASPLLVVPTSTGGLLNNCGANEPIRLYYDGVKNVLTGGFYTTSGFNTNVSASYWLIGPNGGLIEIAQGYVGSFPVGDTDPWDKTVSAAGGAYKSGTLANGIALSLFNAGYGGFYGLGVNSYLATPGVPTNNCDPSKPGSGASVSNRTAQVIVLPAETGGTAGNELYFADSNIPNIIGVCSWAFLNMPSGAGAIISPSPGLTFFIPFGFSVPGGPWQAVHTCVFTRKWVFGLGINNANYPAIVRTSGPASGIYSANSLARSKLGLINFSRPVSVIGKYKA